MGVAAEHISHCSYAAWGVKAEATLPLADAHLHSNISRQFCCCYQCYAKAIVVVVPVDVVVATVAAAAAFYRQPHRIFY